MKEMMLRRLMSTLLLLATIIPVAYCGVTGIEVKPTDPQLGDTVTLLVQASPGETVQLTISFTKTLKVTDGGYELPLDGVSVPQTPNSFTVEATGVRDLSVAAKVFLWFTKSSEATVGVASVSQGGIPSGVYDLRIYGQAASGVSSVKLRVAASTAVTMSLDGGYAFSYDTSAMPTGDFTAGAGDVTKSLTLRPRQEATPSKGTVRSSGATSSVAGAFVDSSSLPNLAAAILILTAVTIFILGWKRKEGT